MCFVYDYINYDIKGIFTAYNNCYNREKIFTRSVEDGVVLGLDLGPAVKYLFMLQTVIVRLPLEFVCHFC